MIDETLEDHFGPGPVFDRNFNPLSQGVQGLIDYLNSAIATLTEARQKIRADEFQATTRVPQALRATRRALTFDRQAITAVRKGNFAMAIEAAVQAVEQTVRAGLFMRGHNPKAGSIRDGNRRVRRRRSQVSRPGAAAVVWKDFPRWLPRRRRQLLGHEQAVTKVRRSSQNSWRWWRSAWRTRRESP